MRGLEAPSLMRWPGPLPPSQGGVLAVQPALPRPRLCRVLLCPALPCPDSRTPCPAPATLPVQALTPPWVSLRCGTGPCPAALGQPGW